MFEQPNTALLSMYFKHDKSFNLDEFPWLPFLSDACSTSASFCIFCRVAEWSCINWRRKRSSSCCERVCEHNSSGAWCVRVRRKFFFCQSQRERQRRKKKIQKMKCIFYKSRKYSTVFVRLAYSHKRQIHNRLENIRLLVLIICAVKLIFTDVKSNHYGHVEFKEQQCEL